MTDHTTTARAARLVTLGMDPARRPGHDEDYAGLLGDYRTDGGLRGAVEEICAGMRLRVLAADDALGLVLAAQPDSPLAIDGTWLRGQLPMTGTEDRLRYGLALVAVAAFCYPTRQSLTDPATHRFGLADVDGFVTGRVATALQAHGGDSEEAPAGGHDVDLVCAAASWTDAPQVELTPTGQFKRGCRMDYLQRACRLLAEQGMLLADPSRDDAWRPTDRFRRHLAHHGGSQAYATVLALLQAREESGPAPGDGTDHDTPGGDA